MKTKDHFIEMPEKPKGAKWNDPAIEIDNIKYRSDGKGYLNQGFYKFSFYL